MADLEAHAAPDPNVLRVLLDNHRRFLSFLKPRVRTSHDAEEILQAAFVKVIDRDASIDQETAVAWFFRLLRNALTDYYRRQAAEQRALRRLDPELRGEEWIKELERTVCECMGDLIPTLKPEYAELLTRVELGGASVQDTAAVLGITPNNAAVRLHRARLALKSRLEECCRTCASHGCFDCTCKEC